MKLEIAIDRTKKITIALKGREKEKMVESQQIVAGQLMEEIVNLKKINMNQSKQLYELKCELQATREQVQKQRHQISQIW